MAGELGRDVIRGGGGNGEIVEDGPGLGFAWLGIGPPHDRARAGLMHRGAKHEVAGLHAVHSPAAAEPGDAPAGKRPRELGDVGLRVARANAQRMQLHDLAREVLVEPGLARRVPLLGAQGQHAVRSDRLGLIEIELHRGVAFDRQQHVIEPPEHMGPDRLGLEGARKGQYDGLVRRDREMVGPEMHQPLDKRRRRGKGAGGARANRVEIDVARFLLQRLAGGLLVRSLGGGGCHHLLAAGDIVRRDGRGGWQSRPARRPRLVTRELVEQPSARVWDRLVGPGAKTKAIERDCCCGQGHDPSRLVQRRPSHADAI